MSSINALLKPRSIAIIGASRRPGKIGHEILRNIIYFGFGGRVYPVNPNAERILGLKCYPSVRKIRGKVDLAVISIPAEATIDAVEECGQKNVKVAVVISSGFREVGRADLEDKLVRKAGEYGVRILGPNVFGVIYTPSKLNASFGPLKVYPGRIAFITQSGALGIALMGYTILEKIGLSAVVSVGNKADIDDVELMEYFSRDKNTSVILIYMESVKDGRKFLRTAMEASLRKPIIVIKAGKTVEGSRAAESHTGALTGSYEAYSAAFKQAGILEALTMGEAFNWARMLASEFKPLEEEVLIITNGGGAGVLAADMASKCGLPLMKLDRRIRDEFRKFGPYFGSFNNPIDLTGMATDESYYEAVRLAMEEDEIPSIITIYCQTANTDPTLIASKIIKAITEMKPKTRKPIVFAGIGGVEVEKTIRRLDEAGIPAYRTPEEAVSAMAALMRYHRAKRRLKLVLGKV